MREVFILLKPQSPLRTGKVKPKGDYLDTLPYLRGSILRGALAEWLKINGKEQEITQTVQKIRFGNLFPSPDENSYPLPFPITAIECKVKGGFNGEGGHGVRDTLLVALAYLEMEKLGAKFPVPLTFRCKECSGRMERVSGFYATQNFGFAKISAEFLIQTKVALSRLRRAAQEQMLYRVVVLRPKNFFVGRVWLDDENLVELLSTAVKNMGIGALTTRGFGKASLSKSNATLKPISERLSQFNEKLREVWSDLFDLAKRVGSKVPEEPNGIYFSVDLLSSAVLKDEKGLPTLKLKFPMNGQFLEPVFWSTQPDFVGGWSTAWGLPKPTALAAAMGSVYVFKVDKPMEDILSHLDDVEKEGLGDRTDEGLGEVLICHPFHLEVSPK